MLDKLNNGWGKAILALIIPTIGVIVGYANLTSDVDGLKRTDVVQQQKVDELSNKVTHVIIDQAVTQNTLEQIQKTLDEIRADIKEIKKRD